MDRMWTMDGEGNVKWNDGAAVYAVPDDKAREAWHVIVMRRAHDMLDEVE